MALHIHYDGRTYEALNIDMETALTDIYKTFASTRRGVYYIETPTGKVALLVTESIPLAIEQVDPVESEGLTVA